MNVLVVAAHPDDEVLGCGATIARGVAEGNDVHIAILGRGRDEGAFERYEQAKSAAQVLGATSCFVGLFPDNQFDTVPLLKLVSFVEQRIRETQPEVIYTHHRGDLNIDHQLTARAVLTAVRPPTPVKVLWSFEVPSSTEWAFDGSFVPNNFVSVTTEQMQRKINALLCYESEMREPPHPRSTPAIMDRSRYWGSVAGVFHAEPFALVRGVV